MADQQGRQAEDAVRVAASVEAPPARAFDVFTHSFAVWWPREYTWSQEVLDTIGLEPFEGGRCFERGPLGFACDWGRVLAWEPPRRLSFSWQIGPDRVPEPNLDKASEVEVRFAADGEAATLVELEHRGFERHGEGGQSYREALGSPQGWAYIVGRYAAAVAELAPPAWEPPGAL